MNRKSTPIFGSILLLLLFVSTSQAITWGEPDGNDHSYVGILYFEMPSGIYRGTGTLLSPTVLLTAGHCTAENGVTNINTWVSFDSEIIFPPGLDINDDTEFKAYLNSNFLSGTAYPHPMYNDYTEFPNTYDVGVVILDEPVVMDEYGQLPPLGLLDTLVRGQSRRDNIFNAVGYGLQGYIPPFYSSDRVRYQGKVTLIEINSAYNGDQQSAKFTNNPGKGKGTGGTCFGDSGGPLFHGDTNVIAAIVSWGITPCIGVDYQFRMDTFTAQDFVSGFLP